MRTNDKPRSLRVFFSYSHDNHKYCKELRDYLSANLGQAGIIETWDDREIPAGTAWDGRIKEELDKADIVLFLVSTSLLNSRYCNDIEVERAFERISEGLKIFPIVLDETLFETTRFAEVNPLPVGADRRLKPILDWSPRRDKAYKLVALAIRDIATKRAVSADEAQKHDALLGKEVPKRKDLVGRDALVGRIGDELTAPPRGRVALVGVGGVGKTAVAVEYACQKRADYDVAAWLHAEEATRLDWEYGSVAKAVGLSATGLESARAAFRTWLEEHDCWLLVFDNAVTPNSVQRLLPENIRGDVLITSREYVWSGFAREVPVSALAEDDAVAYVLNQTKSADRAAARELATASSVRCIPRFLEDAVGTIQAKNIEIGDYLQRLKAREG